MVKDLMANGTYAARAPVSSIPQCKSKRPEGTCLELFQVIGRFETTFIEAHHTSKMQVCNVRSLKSQIKTHSLLKEIITSSNEVIKDFESDMAEGMRKLGNPNRETAESKVIVMRNVGS
jgi:hypothetical protein